MYLNDKELKESASLVDVVSHYIKLKKDGSNYVGYCPFHSEKTPSFSISKNKNIFKCFGCGVSGNNSVEFVMQKEHLTYPLALEKVASIVGFTLEKESTEPIKPMPKLQKVSDRMVKYFESRGISNNTLLHFKITESEEYFSNKKKNMNAICFNHYENNELVHIAFRAGDKSMKSTVNSKKIFYNIDAIRDTEDCIVCEGHIDCLSIFEAGFINCVSVPNGSNSDLRCIDYSYQSFTNKKKIILATDNDKSGIELREKLLFRFGRDKCWIVKYPDGCKDANDVLKLHGKEKLKECIDSAYQLTIEGLHSTEEIQNDLMDMYENGLPPGFCSGIEGLDDYIRFDLGLVTTITGYPSSGKSEVLDTIIVNLAKNTDWVFGVISFENQPIKLHYSKLLEKAIGKSFDFRKDAANRITKDEISYNLPFIEERFKIIDRTRIKLTLENILEKARELILRYGMKALVIDPYNKVLHTTQNMYDANYVNEFMNALNSFAIENRIHIFLVAHPAKPAPNETKAPTLYSISGGANFYNQTDNGIVVYRDREKNLVDIIVSKIRFSSQGKEGFCSYEFNTLTRQYKYITSSMPLNNYHFEKQKRETLLQQSRFFDDDFGDNTLPVKFEEPPF